MTAKVILNPYSNRWGAKARWPAAASALNDAGVSFEVAYSERKGHVTDLAEQAARDGFSPIIAAGGDGTIGETVNGLARAARSEAEPLGPLGIMPLGSANDFVFNLGLPSDLNEAARLIARGNTKRVDLGRLNERYFINNSACGLEPLVTTKHEKIRYVRGILRYVIAAIQGILEKPEWRGRVTWDESEYTGLLTLVSVGNGRRTGGFFMSPHADPFDGKLTAGFGHRPTRWSMLTALPHGFNAEKNTIVELEGMREIHSTKIAIHLEQPSPAHTDGELLPEWIRDLDYSIQPGRVQVLFP
ncbi:MAG: lipid kinase YegS [Anaerolineales bacterium]|nr:lipid kinase YegS [Anaerolineales bacterium]